MIDFLRYACGFLLQVFPVMLLTLLPFERGEFRWGKGRTMAVFSLICLGMAVGMPGMVMIRLNGRISLWKSISVIEKMEISMFSNGYMAVCIILCTVIFCVAIRAELCKRLLAMLLALAYGIIQYMTVNTVIFFCIYNAELYSREVVLLYAISAAVTFPASAFFVKNRLGAYMRRHSMREIYKGLSMAALLTILYSIFVSSIGPAMETLPDSAVSMTYRAYLPYVIGYIFGTVFLCIGYWYMFWEMEKVIEKNNYKYQLNIQRLRYDAIREDMETVRRMKHDTRHHFRVLANFLAEDKTEEAGRYLEHINASMNAQETERFCGDPVVNALLQYYVGEARSCGIACHVRVQLEKNGIDDADMTVILGNCLENAIRACRQQGESAFIRLKIGVVNSTLAILLENSSPEVAYRRTEAGDNGFWSVGEHIGGGGEGIGLMSVAATAKKYDGSVEFKYESGVFYSRISMEIPVSQE